MDESLIQFLERINPGRVTDLGDLKEYSIQQRELSLDQAREKIAKSKNQSSLQELIEAFKDAPDDVEISGKMK